MTSMRTRPVQPSWHFWSRSPRRATATWTAVSSRRVWDFEDSGQSPWSRELRVQRRVERRERVGGHGDAKTSGPRLMLASIHYLGTVGCVYLTRFLIFLIFLFIMKKICIQDKIYSSAKIHIPPGRIASRYRSSTFSRSCRCAASRSDSISCVDGMSVRQNPGGLWAR